jgi:hypothetical protein
MVNAISWKEVEKEVGCEDWVSGAADGLASWLIVTWSDTHTGKW